MYNFYVICPIGLENILQKEIEDKIQLLNPQIKLKLEQDKGGIEVYSEDFDVIQFLNIYIRCATRVLFRIKKQKCRDLPKLYKILKKIDWKKYLQQENIDFVVSSTQSRLFQSNKIEASAKKALKDYYMANQIKQSLRDIKRPNQKIFLRFNHDELTISLDSSGELQHIRSNHKFRGHASIRENYAASLYFFMQNQLNIKRESLTLIDPMCGTGTLLREAQNFYDPIDKVFQFEFWKNIEKKPFQSFQISKIAQLQGLDIDEKIIHHNKETQTNSIKYQVRDLFKDTSYGNNTGNQVVIINPPYGKRVKIEGGPVKYFDTLIKTIKKIYNCPLGIIVPSQYAHKIKSNYRISFNQNGIKVQFHIIK